MESTSMTTQPALSISKCLELMEMENEGHKSLLSSILKLPSEVLLQIFYHLDLSSLLALRASNHLIHALLYRHEHDVVRNYFREYVPAELLTIFPNPNLATPWTLDHLCETLRRYRTCRRLAGILSNAVSERLKTPMSIRMSSALRRAQNSVLYNPLDPRLEFRCLEIRPRLAIGLFILYDFLQRLRHAAIECIKDLEGTMPDEDFTSLTQCLNWDQQSTIEKYPPDLMLEAHHIFNLLSTVVTHRLHQDSMYSNAVRTTFILGGLKAVERCLKAEDLKKTQGNFYKAFGVAMRGGPSPLRLAKTVQHLTGPYQDRPVRDGITRSSDAISAFICSQSIWRPSAMAVMQRRNIEDPWQGNMYRYIDCVLKEAEHLKDLRIILRPWDTNFLI